MTMNFEHGRTESQLHANAMLQSQNLTRVVGEMAKYGAVELRSKVDPRRIRDVVISPIHSRRGPHLPRIPGRQLMYPLGDLYAGTELEEYRGLTVEKTASSHLEMPGRKLFQRDKSDAITVMYREPRFGGSAAIGIVIITSEGRAFQDVFQPRYLPKKEKSSEEDIHTITSGTLFLLRSAELVKQTLRQIYKIDIDPTNVLRAHNTVWEEGFDATTKSMQEKIMRDTPVPRRDGYH